MSLKLTILSIITGLAFWTGMVQAETTLSFEKAVYYGDKNDQTANAVKMGDGYLLVAGGESSANLKGLALGYAFPPSGSPLHTLYWQNEPGTLSSETFLDAAAAREGLYFVGESRSNKTKNSLPFLAKFSADRTASKADLPIWLAKPSFFEKSEEGAFLAVLAVNEGGLPVIYAAGYASSMPLNRTAILAKYDREGKLLWSKNLSDTGERRRAAGTGLAFLDGFVYVAGYTGKGGKKADFDRIPADLTFWKYDAQGQEIWVKKEDEVRGHKVDLMVFENHLYVAAGMKKGNDVLLFKYDPAGNVLWKAKWDAKSKEDRARAGFAAGLAAGKDRLYLCGWTEKTDEKAAAQNEDAFVLEVDKEYGFVLAMHDFGDADRQERALGILVKDAEVYLVGSRSATSGKGKVDNDVAILRYKIQKPLEAKIDVKPDDSSNLLKLDIGKKDKTDKKDKKSGKIAVAIFSDAHLNAAKDINAKSLRFGRTGLEPSWDSYALKDLNQDGILDLLCYFDPTFDFKKEDRKIFLEKDTEGILTGDTVGGVPFIGKDRIQLEGVAASGPAPLPEAAPAPSPEPAPLPSTEPAPVIASTSGSSTPTTPTSSTSTSSLTSLSTTPTQESTPTQTQTSTVAQTSSTEVPLATSATSGTSTDTSTTLLSSNAESTSAVTSTAAVTSSTTTASTSTSTSSSTSTRPLTIYYEPVLSTSTSTATVPALAPKPVTSTTAVSTSLPHSEPVSFAAPLRSDEALPLDAPEAKSSGAEEPKILSSDEKSGMGLAHAYNGMGYRALRQGKLQDAIAHFKEALKAEPDSIEAHNYLGQALVEAGKLEEARDHFSEVLKLDPKNETARKQLDLVLAQLAKSKTVV